MPAAMPESLSQIIASGRIGPNDVLAIRRIVYENGEISADEASWLFDLNHAAREQCEEWRAFFVEALTDYTVYQAAPRGYVTDENVTWLIARIMHDGQVETDTELELLINVLEKAISAPGELSVFALQGGEGGGAEAEPHFGARSGAAAAGALCGGRTGGDRHHPR